MTETQARPLLADRSIKRSAALGLGAVFLTQFVSFLFINARTIAQPGMIAELNGMALFSWLIALPPLAGSASTLLFGKLSDLYGRRTLMLVSIGLFMVGLGVSAISTSMVALVAAATFMSIGHFPIVPLCYTAIGDLFPPAERAKWTGLLSLPTGLAALIGPVLGGVVAESALGWRWLYWGTIPLMAIASALLVIGLPDQATHTKPKVDVIGTAAMIAATTTLILGFSWIGVPETRLTGVILLVISVFAWVGFIWIEGRADAPILDPQVLRSRTFMTAAGAMFLSCFGLVGLLAYSPIFVQQVMKVSPTVSGSMLTPYTLVTAFLGIPVGFWLARTGTYKVLYIASFALMTVAMFAMWRLTAETPIWMYVVVTSVAGLGLGALGTINTLVAQFAVPKRLLGVAVGAMFFFQMVGLAAAPAFLGLAQSSASDLESGLKLAFLVGAVATLAASLLIATIPEVSLDSQ